MRNRFTEWINSGIASFKHIDTKQNIDDFCRMYNNVFGLATDTHMALSEDGKYIITGHIIDTPKWDLFLYSPIWGNVKFGDAIRRNCWTPCQFFSENGYCGAKEIINGDWVYTLCLCSGECQDTPCQPKCPTYHYTSESKQPKYIQNISLNNSKLDVLECFKAKDLNEVAFKLNESLNIKGDNWVAYDGKLVCTIGDVAYII
jgi:hypothetical protein